MILDAASSRIQANAIMGVARALHHRLKGYNRAMNDSMAQPRVGLAGVRLQGWRFAVNWIAAVLLAVLFLSSGIWKVTDAAPLHNVSVTVTTFS